MVQHERQRGPGHAQDPQHVGLQHGFPVFVLALGNGVQPVSAAGVVDEHVEARVRRLAWVDSLPSPGDECVHAGSLADIQGVAVRFGCAGLA